MPASASPAVDLRWLTKPRNAGTTWGVAWPRGVVRDTARIALRGDAAPSLPLQTWPLATWPDGSLKWTGHATTARAATAGRLRLQASGDARADDYPGDDVGDAESRIRLTSDGTTITVDTGSARWMIATAGEHFLRGAEVPSQTPADLGGAAREVVGSASLVGVVQMGPGDDASSPPRLALRGVIERASVEQDGPIRAVIRLEGRFRPVDDDAAWPPPGDSVAFVLRLVAIAGEATLRLQHTLILDADSHALHLAGLGVRVFIPLPDPAYDRHVRIAGPERAEADPTEHAADAGAGAPPFGFLSEAVQGITGLRRDPGERFRSAQVNGQPAGPVTSWAPTVSDRLHWVPRWADWRLEQHSPDGFTLAKRTGSDAAWVTIPGGTRAGGTISLSGPSGGAALSVRDFWRTHPARLDVAEAAGPDGSTGSLTAWLWSPSAPAMDLRPFHDGLGQQSYADQLDALEITYEDWEQWFNTPRGVARTHELTVLALSSTPDQSDLAAHCAAVQDPPLLQAEPSSLHRAGVFGDWSLPDRSTPGRAEIESRLDFLRAFYRDEVEQRRWYGFWDSGDVMHAYDVDRHQWRYDIGGYAWDNSELSPDLWLWYDAMRSGDAESFRLAERMTRHTGEVDVYHAGPWRGLGSRHNVQHWGCSAKQLRIANAAYRRFLYYLTADERVGDLLTETADAEEALLRVDATRKVRPDVYTPDAERLAIGLGTDWGALLAAWLTAWERTGEPRYRDKVLGTMADVAALAQGFFTGEALLDLNTGRFATDRDRVTVSHLSSVFGLVEVCAELIALTEGTAQEVPGFAEAWLRYCRFYLGTPAEQEAEFGHALEGISLVQAHSRLLAWAARRSGDPDLGRRAVRAFRRDENDQLNANPLQRQEEWTLTHVGDATVLRPVNEAPFVSTNDAAQYGLAAIQLLALIPDALDAGADTALS